MIWPHPHQLRHIYSTSFNLSHGNRTPSSWDSRYWNASRCWSRSWTNYENRYLLSLGNHNARSMGGARRSQ